MLPPTEGSTGVDGGGIGPASTLDEEDSRVGVLAAPRSAMCVSRRDNECRMRAISVVGSTLLAKKANLSYTGGRRPCLN